MERGNPESAFADISFKAKPILAGQRQFIPHQLPRWFHSKKSISSPRKTSAISAARRFDSAMKGNFDALP
jgi:hypothetical protein